MIKSIMCCCGSGLGSSMLVRMNVEKTLQKIGVSGVSVTHSSLSDAAEGAADLFVVGKDLENFVKQLPRVVILDNIMDKTELENKLRTEFEKYKGFMKMEKDKLEELKLLSAKIRKDVLEMLEKRGYGHMGGSLSIVELMSVLYGKQLRYDAKNPDWEERDMVVLSKGHSGPAWYSVLAEKGFFDREWLFTLNDGGTKLPSHPDRLKTPGVDMTTGSLGQGTSAAAGIATGFKMNKTDQYVYLIVGDGELNEGQCWEAFQYIAHYKLNHCVVIIDDNKKQLDGTTKEVMNPFSIENKMKAFGFYTQTVKGNDEEAIDEAINRAKNVKDQAVCIILDSIKGAGVPYFEQLDANHSVKFNNDTIKKATKDAIKELDEFIKGGAR